MSNLNSYSLQIRESHLDTFGHVNNATYLALFEEARWDLIAGNGYGLPEIQKEKKGPVILEVNLKFLIELRLREKVQIQTRMLEYPGKVGKLEQKILNSKDEVCALAVFTFGLFDLRERKLILPTTEWKRAIGME